ncbi:hypothetical protein J2W32_005369 [Variovorax boronicumulans]|uniref:Peptidase M28 domain-containing protein n=1 Tax=Variovorax boronicumulans TaxID=436515 RepID=A0AAW8D8I0_9BURK|nr:hypothetical protein [Variovorax boronicumulans]MDP9896388.1 hypothetical protein [Variovorax boronicumulans]MDQ0056301.1 hypothetical protein [Variovorax boronicumulans]
MGDEMDALTRTLADDLARHAALGDKVSGGPGDAATTQWIARRLAELGYGVEQQGIEVPFFDPVDCRLVAGETTAPVYWQSPVTATGIQGLRAPLAVVRAPYEAIDAAGRIALLVLPHARHASVDSPLAAPLVAAASAAGAVALVIVPVGPTGEVVALNADIGAPVAPVPIAVLAPALAEPFLRAARSGLTATLFLHGRTSVRQTSNLQARLRRGPRWLCLSTPRTGWFGCVAERGTGTAAFLAMAAWAVERFPDLSLFLLNTGAHEYRFAGAHSALAQAPAPADTLVWIHLGAALAVRDRLEFRGELFDLPSADANRITMATESLQEAARVAFRGLPGLERITTPMSGVSELGAIVERGYDRAMAVLGIPRAFHTRADDLAEVDARLLAPVVRAHMAVVEAVHRQSSQTSEHVA